jgi:RHS repeat-associated protein
MPTDKKFTGQRLDQTGLYYYNARYYDATIGRFISADTIIPVIYCPQTINRYSYCYNNPLKYIDENGHFGWFAAAAIGALVGAIVNTVVYVAQNYNTGLTGAGAAEAAASGAVAGFVSLVPIPGVQALVSSVVMGAVGGIVGYAAGEGAETAASTIAGAPDQSTFSWTDAAASGIGGACGALLGESTVAAGKGFGNLSDFGTAFGRSLAAPASTEGSLASATVGGAVSTFSSGLFNQYILGGLEYFATGYSSAVDSFTYSAAQFFEAFYDGVWSSNDSSY